MQLRDEDAKGGIPKARPADVCDDRRVAERDPPGPERRSSADRRDSPRVVLDSGELAIQIRSGDQCVRGEVCNISRGGLQVEVAGTMHHYFFSQRRLVQAEIHSNGQPVLVAYLRIVYIDVAADQSKLLVGLQHIGNDGFVRVDQAVGRDPQNFLDRRRHPRSRCELPAILVTAGGDTEQSLPVFLSDISEVGCRIEGPEDLDYLIPGAVIQLCIQPWDLDSIRVLAEVVNHYTSRSLGVRFRLDDGAAERRSLHQLVVAMRYPDLVVGQSHHADKIWETISASGYFRERAPEIYAQLHDHAVQCWRQLNSAAGRAINRTMITPDDAGNIASVCQLSRFYPSTWMAHHLAVMGDRQIRTRFAPQQFGGVFDLLQQVGARYFINFHNTAHKAQAAIWSGVQDHCPRADFSLEKILCYDIAAGEPRPLEKTGGGVRIRQLGAEAALSLLPTLQENHSGLVFSALALDEDMELERLGRDYHQVDLRRHRFWLLAESTSGNDLLGFASLEIVPTGFNLTSIGDHVRLYLAAKDESTPHMAVVARRLLQHATAYFRRLDKPYFVLMAAPRWEGLIARSTRLTPMALAHELVMCDRVFPTVRDYIRRMYDSREEAP